MMNDQKIHSSQTTLSNLNANEAVKHETVSLQMNCTISSHK